MIETTRDIVTKGARCSELISFGTGKPAAENIRTIEPCELLAIDRQGFQKMMVGVYHSREPITYPPVSLSLLMLSKPHDYCPLLIHLAAPKKSNRIDSHQLMLMA